MSRLITLTQNSTNFPKIQGEPDFSKVFKSVVDSPDSATIKMKAIAEIYSRCIVPVWCTIEYGVIEFAIS